MMAHAVHVISGRSVASGLNEDFDISSIDRQNVDILPPVILSVAESELLSASTDAVSSYADSSVTDILPGSRDVADLTAEFYIPPSNLLTASGYMGSHGSLPEVVTNLADGQEAVSYTHLTLPTKRIV